MFIEQERLIKCLSIITKRMNSPERYYTRHPPIDVEHYAAEIVRDKNSVITFAYPASSFIGLNVQELFIAGRVYALSSLCDILPTILWHLNAYYGEVIIAMENDGLIPWIKRKNPHLELDYSIYSGNIEIDVDDVNDSLEKAQWLLLFTGIDLDHVALRYYDSTAHVLKLKNIRKAQIVGRDLKLKAAEKAKKRQQNQKQVDGEFKRRMKKAMLRFEKWSQYEPTTPTGHRWMINLSSIVANYDDSRSAAWNTRHGAPIIGSSGGVIGTRREMLSGEDG